MNPFPEDDKPLTEFLKQHQPVAPPARVDLEDQILTAVEATISPKKFVWRDRRTSSGTSQRRQAWLIPSTIAAGIIVTVVGYRAFAPTPQPNPAEVADLEAFIENNWSNTVTSDPSADHTYDQFLPVDNNSSVN